MNKKSLITVIFLFLSAGYACAETYPVSGKVVDSITGEALEGAVVLVKEENKTVTAGKDGIFTFETAQPAVTIVSRLPGYAPYKEKFTAPYADMQIKLEITSVYTMDKIFVRDKFKIEGTKNKVKAEEIKKTTAQLFSDSLKVVQTLPGVITGNDFSSLMYIRGGEFYEMASLLDGIYIVSPYMWGGIQSIFNPTFVDKVDFYSGGFPARYPQSLSGVLDIQCVEGDMEKYSGFADLSPATFEFFAEGPIAKNKASFATGLRRTYYDLLMNLTYGDKYKDIVFPYFYDTQSKMVWKPNERDKLSFNLLGSLEGMDMKLSAWGDDHDEEDDAGFHYKDQRLLPAFGWERAYSENTSIRNIMAFRFQEGSYKWSEKYTGFDSKEKYREIFLNSRLKVVRGRHTFEQGLYAYSSWVWAKSSGHWRTLMPDGSYYYDSSDRTFDWMDVLVATGYLQDDIELMSEKLYVNIGGTLDHLSETDDTVATWKTGAKYALTENTTLKFNTGLYSQFAVIGTNGPPPIIENDKIKSEKAYHYVAGVEQELAGGLLVRLEGYIKDYFDKVVADPDPALKFTNKGIRRADGIDLFLQKKKTAKWDGWLAYSWLEAKDKILERSNPADFEGESTLNYREPVNEWYPFEKERKHNASLVYNYEFSAKYKLALTYRYSTGTPYTGIKGAMQYGEVYVPVYGKFRDSTLPDIHRMDVKLAMPFFGVKKMESYIQFINLLNHKNVDSYYYNDDYTERTAAQMLPMMFIGGIRYNF